MSTRLRAGEPPINCVNLAEVQAKLTPCSMHCSQSVWLISMGSPALSSLSLQRLDAVQAAPPAHLRSTYLRWARFPGASTSRVPCRRKASVQLGGWSECAAQHEDTVYAGDVLVTNGKLQNALVYIEDGLGGRVFAVPEEPVENDQKGCVFLPRIMAIRVDQPIRYLNSDPMAHNVHGLPRNSSH